MAKTNKPEESADVYIQIRVKPSVKKKIQKAAKKIKVLGRYDIEKSMSMSEFMITAAENEIKRRKAG